MELKRVLKPGCSSVLGVCILVAAVLTWYGCKSAGSAVRIEQRKAFGITSVTIGEYTFPAFTLSEGPSVSTYQSKDAVSEIKIDGSATTTNKTSAFGIYENEERKTLIFTGTFKLAPTNMVESVK